MTLGTGIESNAQQIMVQIKGILFTAIYAPLATFVILYAIKLVMGLRVSEEDEFEGLDVSQHSESAYSFGGGSTMGGAVAGGAHAAESYAAPQTRHA